MSTLNFPNNPSVNDEYSFGARTWRWTGSAWEIIGIINPVYATTGSNTFEGNQVINGDLEVTGSFTLGSNTYPSTLGPNGYVLTADGTGTVNWDFVRTIYEEVKNGDIVTLAKGTPVHVVSTTGNLSVVVAADASDPDLMPATYILAQDLEVDEEGLGIILGFINGVDTSAFTEGDVVYVASGGGYTNVKPNGDNLIQPLGIVIRVDDTNGSGLVLNPGVTNGLPNLENGHVWIGSSTGEPIEEPISNLSVGTAVTASYAELAATASYVEGTLTTGSNTFIGNQTISGSIFVSQSFGTGSAVVSATVNNIVTLTSASYAALTPVSGTLYLVI